MKSDLVIALAGRIGAGKSSISQALADDLRCKRASFGDFIRSIVAERGLEQTRENCQAVGEEFERSDPRGFCMAVLKSVGWRTGEPVVIDGVRHLRILQELKGVVAPQRLFFVFLDAEEDVRQRRLERRSPEELGRLRKIESHSTERDVLAELPHVADVILSNSMESQADLVRKVKSRLP